MNKNYQIIVSGKVQGVFFRTSTKKKAVELGIAGFVRNESDGSVFIVAEGNAGSLKKFIEWCHEGPPKAEVKNVNIKEGNFKGFSSFEQLR